MATVYLCIGTQKTGTTSLQYFMRENEDILEKQGYSYPYMDMGFPDAYYKNRNGHFLAHHYQNREEGKKKKKEAYQFLGELAKKYDNIVLSDEIIWYRCNQIKNFWKVVSEEIQKIGCTLKVVVYLRRQDAIVQSLWNQKVKGLPGITQDFQTYFKEDMFEYFPLDYYKQLHKIAGYVGKENLLVRVYEKGQFNGRDHDLLSDYLNTLGIQFSEEFRLKEDTLNHGLDGNFIELKRILNGVKEYQDMDNFMRMPLSVASDYQLEQNPFQKTSMFTYEQQVEFVNKYKDSNEQTARVFLNREDGILFREPVRELPVWKVNRDDMYRDLFVFMVEMFCAQQKKINGLNEKIKNLEEKTNIVRKDIRTLNNNLIFRGYRKVKHILKNRESIENKEITENEE